MSIGSTPIGPLLTVRLLGQFSLAFNGQSLKLPSRPAQSLLAWLILHPGIAHRRERLAGLFWPDATEENARNNLRHALWRLRRDIPEEFLETDNIAIRWVDGGGCWLDVDALTASPASATSADELLPALQAYGGELLPGFYDEWVFLERERLDSLYEDRMAQLLELLLAGQRWRETIDWAEKWIAGGRTPEQAYRALMMAHASQGDTAAALTAYQRCVDALKQELGVPSSAATDALADSIRNSQFTIRPFDRLRTPHSPFSSPIPPLPRTNLPAATTLLVGRDSELAQLSALLADPAHRLVTILGPGGMGKSRLALAASRAVIDSFPDGVFLVELASLTNAEELPRVIGDALNYPFQNDSRPPRRQLLDYLRGRRLLLLLDNFEHLLEGAELLIALLEVAPDLQLLITSRERLRLHAETIFRLAGLGCPPGSAAMDGTKYDAVDLFVQSARRMRQGYTPSPDEWPTIARICRLVDGMPLGLVLAASWIEHLPPAEIADEIAANIAFLGQDLHDLDQRHRTIEAVFEQSWQRLAAPEKQALMGLSIFVGGFDRQAAQAVAAASLPLLTRLVDKALLWRVGEGRYNLHELVRQLARQKLIEAGEEEAIRRLHSRWFLALVSRQEVRIKGMESDDAIELMERERENVRAAWDWATQNGETDSMLSAMETLGIFYHRPGYWEEGETLLGQTAAQLDTPSTPQAHLLHGWLWAWHGLFFHQVSQPAAAQEALAQALALAAESPLPESEISPLRAFVYLHRAGDLMTNRQRREKVADMQKALDAYQQLGNDWWTVYTLVLLGHSEIFSGSIRKAKERLQQALHIAQRSGNRPGETQALQNLSFAAEHMGKVDEGERLARQALATIEDPAYRQSALGRLAFVLLATGKFEESISVSQTYVAWAKQFGADRRNYSFAYNNLARAYLDQGRFAEGKAIALEAVAGWKKTYGWEQPFLLRAAAMGTLALGDATEARRLIQSTVESQQQMGNDNSFALSGAYVDCAYPALALGDWGEARRMLAEGLHLIQRSDAYQHTCLALPAAGLLFAAEERLAEAAFVNGAIQRYPCLTGSRWYGAVALHRLIELLAPLPADERAAAAERGSALDLPEMTAALLEMLETR